MKKAAPEMARLFEKKSRSSVLATATEKSKSGEGAEERGGGLGDGVEGQLLDDEAGVASGAIEI